MVCLPIRRRECPPARYAKCREQAAREVSPTAMIIDAQSVKSAEKGGAHLGPQSMTPAGRSKARNATS